MAQEELTSLKTVLRCFMELNTLAQFSTCQGTSPAIDSCRVNSASQRTQLELAPTSICLRSCVFVLLSLSVDFSMQMLVDLKRERSDLVGGRGMNRSQM